MRSVDDAFMGPPVASGERIKCNYLVACYGDCHGKCNHLVACPPDRLRQTTVMFRGRRGDNVSRRRPRNRLFPMIRPFRRALAAVLLLATAQAGFAQAPRSVMLEDLTWTEVRDAQQAGKTTILVPIGGTEQSGPGIALGKHNARAAFLAQKIAERLGNALVAPVVAYVPEGAVSPPQGHMKFPGTITIPDAAFEATLVSAAQSFAAHGFRNVVFLGDHGGYQNDLKRVVAQLDKAWAGKPARAFVPAAYYQASSDGFAAMLRKQGYRDDEIGTHAGLADTSLQLAVAPRMVRLDALQHGPKLGAADGVFGGDPRRSSAALGQAGVDAIVARTVDAIRQATAGR
jgi:creatinine amidohydrolase/Fe(II)-dependent formamide hydrolase-like protein